MTDQACYLCNTRCIAIDAGGLAYNRCTSCGLIMRADARVDSALIERLYGEDYYDNEESYPDWEGDPELLGLLRRRLRDLAALVPARGRLLDIGCGLGHFLQAAARDGWDGAGMEPSRHAAQQAAARTGLPIYRELDDLVARNHLPFDCVTMWDVLEHDSDPVNLLRRARDILRPGGALAVSMPNLAGIESRLRGTQWRYFRPEFGHITHHTVRTLSLLLGRAGFQVIQSKTEGSLNLSGRLPDPLARYMQHSLDRTVEAFQLGRNITVYASRR